MAGKTKTGSGERRRRKQAEANGASSGTILETSETPAMTNGTMSLATAALNSGKRAITWEKFAKKLVKQHANAKSLARLFRIEKCYALEWTIPQQEGGGTHESSLRDATRKIGKTIAGNRKLKKSDVQWLELIGSADSSKPISFEQARFAIALASILPRLAEKGDESKWWSALRTLISMTDTSRVLDDSRVVVRQMLTIELPLVLARQLPSVPACKLLCEPASEFIIVEQSELLDSDGWIRASHVADVPLLLSTWTRCWFLLEELDRELSESGQVAWEWFVRQAMRLLRNDEQWMLSDAPPTTTRELIQAAVATSTDKTDQRIVNQLLRKKPYSKKKRIKEKRESTFSEWAGLGVLRSNWNSNSPKVAVVAGPAHFEMEICRDRKLMMARGLPEVSVNGRQLKPVSEWEAVCDHVDKSVEYLELEINFESDVVLQRQICLARNEQFLYLADVVLSKSVERIDYSQVFSPPPSVAVLEETETREMYLCEGGPVRALLMPLAMPEWKSARSDHSLTQGKSGSGIKLTLAQSALCQNLCAGLFIDLSPKRSCKPRTWRQLTVAESLEIVSSDVAVAWRVRTGKDQYVFYRSMTEPSNRSFIGQNYAGEFFVGKFEKDGNATQLLSIEP